MPREHARVKLSIWDDDDFRSLTGDAQRLYFLLMTSLKLDYAGVTDWRPGRLASLCRDWTDRTVQTATQELSERLYVIVDESTEEILLRSFIRHDGLMESPNLAVAMRKALGAVASSPIRMIVVHELIRLHKDKPELKGWTKVSELLDRPSLNPSEYPSYNASATPSPWVPPTPTENPSETPSPTTAPSSLTPATAPNSPPTVDTTKRRRTQIPTDWKPSENDIEWQRREGIPDAIARRELPRFIDHWTGKGEARADWSATWRNWLRRAGDYSGAQGTRPAVAGAAASGVQPWER